MNYMYHCCYSKSILTLFIWGGGGGVVRDAEGEILTNFSLVCVFYKYLGLVNPFLSFALMRCLTKIHKICFLLFFDVIP